MALSCFFVRKRPTDLPPLDSLHNFRIMAMNIVPIAFTKRRKTMKVKRNTLLLLACLVWSAAGFNILRIGLTAYPDYRGAVNYLLSALVFTVFQLFIFGRLVKKHTTRISAYEEELHFFLKFFDVKSFAIMAVMMSGGIALRSSGLASERFIAFFYTGLGASLLLAGLLFGCHFGKATVAAKKERA